MFARRGGGRKLGTKEREVRDEKEKVTADLKKGSRGFEEHLPQKTDCVWKLPMLSVLEE
jgi:hypothetical protein